MAEFQQFKVDAPAGINFTREPSQLPAVLWDEGENIAFRHGITKKCSGYEQGFGTSFTTPECIVPLRDDSQEYFWWAYVGAKAVEDVDNPGKFKIEDRMYRVLSKGVHHDVTPTGGLPESEFARFHSWTGDTLNGIPYLCKDKPFVWDKGAARFRPMNKFPEHLHFSTMRTYRNFMVGLNFSTDDQGEDFDNGFGPWARGTYQNALWWSQSVVGSELDPDTDMDPNAKSFWCDADPEKDSGWNFLGGAGGPIVDGKALRDGFIIYRERSVWQMTYIGGINVFSFKELFDDAGALGLDCIAEVEGHHIVIGQSDVYMHNGVQKQSIADGIVRKEIFNSIDPEYTDKVFIATNYKDKEAWICIPESGTHRDGACNVAYVYNWEEKTWGRRDLPDVICSIYTILSLPEEDTTWEARSEGGPSDPATGEGHVIPGSTWEEATDRWIDSYFKYNPSDWGLAMGSARLVRPGEEKLWHDEYEWMDTELWNDFKNPVTESEYFIYTAIDEPLINGRNYVGTLEKKWVDMGDRTDASFVNKIYPLVRKGFVDVYMAGSTTVDEGLVWRFIGTFDPSRDTKLSCRVSGEFIHTKFVIPERSRAEIRGYTLEWSKIGRRS